MFDISKLTPEERTKLEDIRRRAMEIGPHATTWDERQWVLDIVGKYKIPVPPGPLEKARAEGHRIPTYN